MDELIIKFEPFTLKQTIFIKHEDGSIGRKEIPQSELTSFISLHPDICKIHFFGNEEFVSKIKEECITKYKMNNIDFCVNC